MPIDKEREVLTAIVCNPPPPGTDHVSAIWGASRALQLMRDTEPPDTLLNGTYNIPLQQPFDPFVDPRTLKLGDRVEVTVIHSENSQSAPWIGEIVSLSSTHITIRTGSAVYGDNSAVFPLYATYPDSYRWRLLNRSKSIPKIGDRISGPDVFLLPVGSIVRSNNSSYKWVVVENDDKRLIVGLLESYKTHYSLRTSSRYEIIRIGIL